MDGSQLSVLFIICTRATDEVFQEEEVPWTTLNDRKQPVTKLQFSASRARFLSSEKRSECWIIYCVVAVSRRWRGQVAQGCYY